MNSMSMSSGSSMKGHTSAMVGGMNMGHGGGTNILPSWLAVIWTLLFIGILVVHARHIADSEGQRKVWHSGHVLMALGMVFMYAPASIDTFNIPAGFWQLVFANAALAAVLFVLAQLLARRAVNVLWIVMAVDMGAMAYMWSPSGFQAPLIWILVAYFAVQALLWGTDRMRSIDHRSIGGVGMAVTPEGAVALSAAEPLVCFRDLRASMALMTVGMAYMFAAMQLLS